MEGTPSEEALQRLREGVQLSDGPTQPASARVLPAPPALWPRAPPVRVRLSVPTAWLELRITEGRNRQARGPVAGPTRMRPLRLVLTDDGARALRRCAA